MENCQIVGYKINMQKYVAILYGTKLSEREMKKQ